jgi:sigma-B regulation protein RsbQ
LLLQCQDDAVAPLAVGEYLHQHLQNSNFQEMQATGHCPHMSHPEETIALMENFLSSQP